MVFIILFLGRANPQGLHGPSALVPAPQAVLHYGFPGASVGRAGPPAPHPLPPPGAAAPVCRRHPCGACRNKKTVKQPHNHHLTTA